MSGFKRDYCILLAKEDARRFQTKQDSLCTVISGDKDLEDLHRVLSARAPKQITHLRTVDAWMRRASAVRMPQLRLAAERYATAAAEKTDVIDMASVEQACPVEDVLMLDTDPDQSAPAATTEAPPTESLALDTKQRQGGVSIVSLRDPEAQSVISAASQAKSAATKSRVSVATSHKSRNFEDAAVATEATRAESAVSATSRVSKSPTALSSTKVPPPLSSSAPSPPAVPPPPNDDAMSRISLQEPRSRGSTVGTSVSLASVGNIAYITEEAINTWYHESASNLEGQYEDGVLRQEQFKRKRALLRADYWTRLDKLRNNATPTVIG